MTVLRSLEHLDPYEGETMTQIMYLFSQWDSDQERELLWEKKREMFQSVKYVVPKEYLPRGVKNNVITVQKGYEISLLYHCR